MATVLAISSHVARGAIGLSAAVPALRLLDHEVWPIPTVVLSNHPGHPHAAGIRIPAETGAAMVGALEANGWLGGIDAILTGYLPTAGHVAMAAAAIAQVRALRPDLLVVCDPVLGDAPKGLYVDAAAAEAIRDTLIPSADIATPNRFELDWLTGAGDDDPAARAARLGPKAVVVTSADQTASHIRNLLVGAAGVLTRDVPHCAHVPNGTGDLLAALFLGHRLNGHADAAAFARAVDGVEAVVAASGGRDELRLPITADGFGSGALSP